jgi:ATP-binding cassette subfamily F protein 3
MLVSHDRALLRSVCDEFWMVSRGGVEPFDGDLDDYQRYLLDESKRLREELKAAPAPKAAATSAPAPAAVQRKQDAQSRQEQNERLRPIKKQIEKLDRSMAALTEEKAALEQRLTQPLPPAEIAEAGRRLKQVDAQLSAQEEEWLGLSEQLETS